MTKKKFVIAIDIATDSQIENIHGVIDKLGLGWWHWLQRTWLIASDTPTAINAEFIRDRIYKAEPTIYCVVLEIPGETSWAAVRPSADTANGFATWLNKYWK